jgi:hypothetical protein
MSGDSLSFSLPLSRFEADSCEATNLCRELRKPLLRYLVCLGLSADEAQDVVQDAFLSLHRHLASDGSQENIRSPGCFVSPIMAREIGSIVMIVASTNHSIPTSTRLQTGRHPNKSYWKRRSSVGWERRSSY